MAFYLASAALLVAAVAVGWLVGVNKRLSDLGMRVLESEDVNKIIDAANKTSFFESRVTACEEGTKQSQSQLAEHGTKLGELAANLGATENLAKRNETGSAEVSEKTASFESRVAACENRTEQSENRLSEQEAKANELFARLEAAEQMLNEHAAGLAQANENIKVADEAIKCLAQFQTVTEKARNAILAALNDMSAGMPVEVCSETGPETAESEDTPREPEEGPKDDNIEMEPQAVSSEVAADEPAEEGDWFITG
jgi:hypothetical protein